MPDNAPWPEMPLLALRARLVLHPAEMAAAILGRIRMARPGNRRIIPANGNMCRPCTGSAQLVALGKAAGILGRIRMADTRGCNGAMRCPNWTDWPDLPGWNGRCTQHTQHACYYGNHHHDALHVSIIEVRDRPRCIS